MQNNLFAAGDLPHVFREEMNLIEKEWLMPTSFPDLSQYKQIAVDLETKDPRIKELGPGWSRKDGHIIGIAIAAGDQSWYLPIRHANGQNLDAKMTMKWLAKQLADPEKDVIMHNATYDAGWLRAEGVEVAGRIIDTMITGALVDENRWSFGLDAMARDYAEIRKDEKLLQAAAKEWGIDPKADMWQLPPKYVGLYAEQDAVATLKLWEALKIELERQDLWSIWNLENSLIPCLLDMRTNGVRVDLEKAERNKKLIKVKADEQRKILRDAAGFDVDIWAAASIAKMFDKLEISYPTTEQGSPSFTKQFLNAHEHPVTTSLVRLRELDKADATFIDSILKHEHKGRIHTELHSTRRDEGGTVTGRFSSSNPNLQQIPARDPEIKKLIRGLFIPEEGCKWGSFDYSSQEPRLLVHFAASMPESMQHPIVGEIVEAFNTGDVDLHQMVADIAGISRKEAKTVNLGIMYGMGVAKLANQLAISDTDAKILLGTHHDRVPFVRQLAETATRQAEKNGQIRTLLGRLCRFDMWEPSTFGYNKPLSLEEAQKAYGGMGRLRRAFTYKALNRLIQGSAADQTKKAMLDCYNAGLTPMLTVHDELCFSVENDEQAGRIRHIMETGCPLKVPSKIDVALEADWGDVE
jgi:DNA polymerase I-like protein with 3'-5' exonuclease and polymerase domains